MSYLTRCPWCDAPMADRRLLRLHTDWERKREQRLIPEETPDPVKNLAGYRAVLEERKNHD